MKDKINSDELVIKVAKSLQLTKKDAEEVIRVVFSSISSELSVGNTVSIYNFGKFTVSQCKEHLGYDVIHQKPINVSEKKTLKFKASTNLKKELNNVR
jgi:nucleoid DNA-binding protein